MFSIVATPIGNLEDMTFRAVETLKNSDIILCEDTRHSMTIINKFDIKAKLISYHKFNETERVDYILSLIREGKNISLITDAGTPIISDPGYIIVKVLKENGISYTSIPGACAMVNAVVLSGIDCGNFTFYGFLPEGKKRKEFLQKITSCDTSMVFYISPHKIKEDIADLYKALGERKGSIIREMTKIHEEVMDITLCENFETEVKGEMVLVLEKKESVKVDYSLISPMEHLMGYINSGMEKNEAIKKVAKERNVPKNDIYKLLNK